jgi:hypothetical protein
VAEDERYLDVEVGPLRFSATDDRGEPPRSARRKVAIGVSALLAVAAAGILLGISVLRDNGAEGAQPSGGTAATTPASGAKTPGAKPTPLKLTPAQVRIVDPDGDRTELEGAAALVDGDRDTAWESDTYKNLPFGDKRGMGILIKLAEPTVVTSVRVSLSGAGASARMVTGTGDRGNSTEGDRWILSTYKNPIGVPIENHEATTLTFGGFLPDEKHQYLLVWFNKLPRTPDDRLRLEVQDLVVEAR